MENIQLKQISLKVRKHIIEGIYNAQSGHPGGSLSISDLLAILYFEVMNVDPSNPKCEDRDRFVLSKGHCAPALYGILAERGFIPSEDIKSLRRIDSYLQGHPDMKHIPGVDMSTGSLGQGISAANGMALAAKLDGRSYNVYTVLGDGELEEGQVWEAAMFAAHYKLDNLIAFVDFNGLQIDGKITDVMSPCPIDKKFEAFGWDVQVIDGHDYDAIRNAIENAKKASGKPSVVVMNTVKGKGVSFMENQAGWHGVAPKEEEYISAMAELDAVLAEIEKEVG